MYQGGSDGFLGPRDDIPLADESWGCDFEAEVAVVTGDVPMGASRDEALDLIRLVMLANDVSLRNLIPGELAKSFGSSNRSRRVVLTGGRDAIGAGRRLADGRLSGPVTVDLNGRPFGRPDAGST